MTIKLDTTLEAFEKDGGDENFIKSVTKLLDIDRKLMIITQKRQGSVIVTFRVQNEGNASIYELRKQIQNVIESSDIGYSVIGIADESGEMKAVDKENQGKISEIEAEEQVQMKSDRQKKHELL